MATGEDVLQINGFEGVDRLTRGTKKKPWSFFSLQNWSNPNPGELKATGGVTNLTGVALPGVSEIKYTKFLDLGQAEKTLVAYYLPSVESIPAPSGQTYSTSGGGATSRDVYLMYVGPGNSYSKSTPASQSIQANGLTVTCPTNVPDYISCIHVFIANPAGTFFWSGSFTRRANVFPTSITCPLPGTAATAYPSAPILSEWIPAKFSVSYGTSGSLSGNRQYYFGVAPWISGRDLEVAYKTTNSKVLSCYLPDGNNSIDVVFDFLPLNLINSNTSPSSADVAFTHACVFMGPTIEDGLIVANNKSDGTVLPTAVSSAQTQTFNGQTEVDSGNDTITVSGNFPENALLKYTVSGTAIGGLTTGSYYWTIDVVYDASANTTTMKLANTQGGSAINITAAGGASTATLSWRKVSITIKEIPYNSDLWSMCDSYDLNTLSRTGLADEGRDYGIISLEIPSTPASQDPKGLGCMAFSSLPHVPSERRELLSNITQKSFTVIDHTPQGSVLSEFYVWSLCEIQSRQYAGRLHCVNNYNTPFYTNGYVLKPQTVDTPSSGTVTYLPITEFIEFFKDCMVLAGRYGNTVYDEGYFYVSEAGQPSDFGNTSTLKRFAVRAGDQSEILGLNIYSQDVSNVGPTTFLVVGKRESIFTWDGDSTHVPQQIDKSVGFAGPDCYTLTRFGPVYVGRDNIYLLRNTQEIVPVGDNFKDIIQKLTDDQLFAVQAVYHEEEVKIGYTDTEELDREIWLRLWYQDGGINKTWTGPHLMKEYTKCTTISSFLDERNYRACFLGDQLYRRDDPGSFLNDGVPITRIMKIRDLGFMKDHLLKLITRFFLGLYVTKEETFECTLESQDGSQSIVVSADIDPTGDRHEALEFWIPKRFLARVFASSIEVTSDGDMSCFDLSFFYKSMRRRTLP